MTRKRSLLALATTAAFALPGCSDRAAKEKAGAHTEAQAAMNGLRERGSRTMGMPMPEGLPHYALVPPDSFVASVVPGQSSGSGLLEYSTMLTPAAVLEFYRISTAQAGLIERAGQPASGSVAWQTKNGTVALIVDPRPVAGAGSYVRLQYR